MGAVILPLMAIYFDDTIDIAGDHAALCANGMANKTASNGGKPSE